jgi:predicted MFS family arabinose efflux permease
MENRWLILAVLFLARIAMGFQFQSVGSVSSFFVEDLDINYARLGTLIGLYNLPGVVLAFPGGLLGKRFGDKRVVVMALGLMAIGGSVMGVSNSYALAVAGRLLSGAGSALLGVLLTKMVADWFAGREIVTAMAILVSSWPLGISLALISLGPLATAWSWLLVMHLTAAVCLIALVLVVAVYRTPSSVGDEQETKSTGLKLSRQELWLVTLAGLIWALFNVGLASLPSFAPEFLTSTGYTIAEAGSLVSVVTWIVTPSVQVGGYIAERVGRPNLIMVTCFFGIGLAICLLPYCPHPLALFIALGLLFGPPAGIIMALPTEILRPENRAPGMGLFLACSNGGMTALTALAGLSRDLTQSPAAPLLFSGTLLFITIIILGLLRAFQRRSTGMTS